jgi:hypothetical protein
LKVYPVGGRNPFLSLPAFSGLAEGGLSQRASFPLYMREVNVGLDGSHKNPIPYLCGIIT